MFGGNFCSQNWLAHLIFHWHAGLVYSRFTQLEFPESGCVMRLCLHASATVSSNLSAIVPPAGPLYRTDERVSNDPHLSFPFGYSGRLRMIPLVIAIEILPFCSGNIILASSPRSRAENDGNSLCSILDPVLTFGIDASLLNVSKNS